MDTLVEVYCIGGMARRALKTGRRAAVRGTSTRGVFLGLDSGWVVFLSTETFRGPLTLNLRWWAGLPESPLSGDQVLLDEEGLEFVPAGPFIRTGEAETWLAPPAPDSIHPPQGFGPRLEAAARRLLTGAGQTEQACLLGLLLEGSQMVRSDEVLGQTGRLALALQQAFSRGHLGETVQAAEALLGSGPGLTPLGDDILAGLLLSRQRYPHVIQLQPDLAGLEREIVPRAYRLTTTMSANLIECASLGQVDERLVGALDGLLAGEQDPDRIARALAGWGNSSGAGVLAGIWLALMPPDLPHSLP